METDSSSNFISVSPRVRIIKRLVQKGIPLNEFDKEAQSSLVAHVMSNLVSLPEIVFAILPSDEDALKALWDGKPEHETSWMHASLRDLFQESFSWLQWLMFEGDPVDAMNTLSEMSKGQRGVCGAVWGNNDIAYRCRSCENDPTCAICVPCFQNGVHKNHDYSIIYTGGGCCDCGDVTAWKRDGFCSEHRGADHIQSLPVEWKLSVGTVLDAILTYWRDKLLFSENIFQGVRINKDVRLKPIIDQVSFLVILLLLNFCQCSEGLLNIVSKAIVSVPGLLDLLVKSESFLGKEVWVKHHELLLKLIGEPTFKYEFSKAFITYYPSFVKNVIKACSASILKDHSFMSVFSVQIFTVPTLTLQLVKEMGLIEMLIGCLVDIFVSCAGEDGKMQVSKWGSLFDVILRVVEDIRFVLSHDEIPKYVTDSDPEIMRTWIKLLSFVHGANSQKRETNMHVEEENENTSLPFIFGLSIANINSLLVDAALNAHSDNIVIKNIDSGHYKPELDGGDSTRHAKVGRLSQESSASSAVGITDPFFSTKPDPIPFNTIPRIMLWLVYECLKAIDDLFEADKNKALTYNVNVGCNNFSALSQAFFGLVKEKHVSKLPNVSQGYVQNLSLIGLNMAGDIVDARRGLGQGINSEMMYIDNSRGTPTDNSSENDKSISEKAYFHLLSLSEWPNITYDVSLQDASVHIPLHRLLSLILHKTLKHFYGEGDAVSLESMNYDFFKIILNSCHPYGFSAFIMEHPLRNRVFCAQVRAGMWRRNGDSALLSCGWYCSVRWGGQDLEYDLFLLQCCAALAPCDLFVKRILERFGLSSYLSLNTESPSGYEPELVHGMLILLIHIVKERRFSGLSTEESLRRELIFRLSIGDATHSSLLKSLPQDLSKFDKIQSILNDIALYSSPTGINQGTYSLKWECWRELDLYHPRSNSRELQVAEERYLRFCSVSAPVTQLPNWLKVYHPLSGIARVGTCATVLEIVRAVIFYSVNSCNPTDSRAPDVVVLTALHLLALALDICLLQKKSRDMPLENEDMIPIIALSEEAIKVPCYGGGDQNLLSLLVSLMRSRKSDNLYCYTGAGNGDIPLLVECLLKRFAEVNYKCLIKLQKIAPEVVHHLVKSTSDSGVDSNGSEQKIKSRERQAAIMAKMKAQQSRFLENVNSISDNTNDNLISREDEIEQAVAHDSEIHREDVCALCHDSNSSNSLSYMILLQKSRLLSFVDRGTISWDLLDDAPASVIPNLLVNISQIHAEKCLTSQSMNKFLLQISLNTDPGDMFAIMQFLRHHSIAFGKIPELCGKTALDGLTALPLEILEEESFHSILKEMQRDFNTENGDTVVVDRNCGKSESILVGKYIAALSKELKESPFLANNFFKNSNRDLLDIAKKNKELHLFGPYDSDGINISSCGHAVHQECLDRYLCSLKERHNRRISFEGRPIVDSDKGEFLCPVCRRLANAVLPTCVGSGQGIQTIPDCTDTRLIHQILSADEEATLFCLPNALSLIKRAADVLSKKYIRHTFPPGMDGRIDLDLKPLLRTLHDMYFSGNQDKMSQPVRTCYSMIMWDTVKYSIMSMEISARSRRTFFKPSYDTDALYDGLKSTNGFIMSLFLKSAQNFRGMRSVEALQRFIGLQLLNKSICLEAYEGEIFRNTYPQDDALSILKLAEKEVQFHDVQFWKRCSDPVISHDPFSSLMLVLFCLPCPFLICQQSFVYLVHLFYAVSITQAAITYVSKYRCEIRKEDFQDCLVDDIYNLLGEVGVSRQNFVSNYYMDYSSFNSVIRSLSFPYLRRCVLLWKLIKYSPKSAFSDTRDAHENICDDFGSEMFEEEKLCNIFMLPPLEFFFKDAGLRSLASKWCRHFYEITERCNPNYVLYCTPVVPFKLVKLPDMYQVLLERYIKTHLHDCKPALCLLCGNLCSSSMRPCCGNKIGCQDHARTCGSGIGVFLMIRKTTILLQRSARKSHWPSPYLDSHGEEDVELRRGNPLYLNEERYAMLTHMVASHGLDQSSNVIERTTVGTLFMV